jgi:hypothetical protein
MGENLMAHGDTGIKAEHEPLADKGASDEIYQPTPEEAQAVALVKKLFKKAKKHRSKYDERWMGYYKMFRGKQWAENRPSYRHSEVLNLIFTNLQSQTALMTDSRPKISFTPQEPTDLEFTEIINDVCESDWERGAWLMPLCEVILDSHLYGIGYSEEGFSGMLDQGQGSATYQSIDPLEMYPDPDAVTINDQTGEDKSSFIIRAQAWNVDKLKARYPDKAQYLKADLQDLWNEDRSDIHTFRYRSPTDRNRIVESQGGGHYGAEHDMALLVTCWVKDNSIIEEMCSSYDDAGTEKVEYETRKKYPRGRKVVICGDVLLEDGENPYEDGEFPYSKVTNYLLSREFYGISEVENLESPQKIFNKLVSFSLDVLVLMGNPIWIIPTTSGIDTDTVYNRPGMILEPDSPNHGIQRQEGVQLQPYVLQMVDSMQRWFDTIGGSNDITRGTNPTGVSAASAITQLQDAAQTRIRLKMRNLDGYLKSVARHWLSRVLQYYSVQRVYRVTGKDETQKYFKMSIATKPDGQKVARIVPYLEMGGKQHAMPMKEIPIQVQSQFDIQAQTGSSLPFAKAEKEQRAYQLFDRGIIDEEEVLKLVDYPNPKAVLDRVAKKKAQAAQAEQQAAQAGG